MKISVSEINAYMRCRRRWDLSSVNRQALRRVGPPPTALHVGAAIHFALGEQATGRDPMEAFDSYCTETEAEIAEQYRATVGVDMSAEEWARVKESEAHARDIVERYFNHYGWVNPIAPFEYIQTEVTFRVRIPGTKHFLAGTFDGLAKDPRTGKYWIVEHKTFTLRPDIEVLSTHHQMQHYCWAAWHLFGEPVAGVLYDGISKKLPTVPRLTQRGQLSRANITTDAATYRRAIREHNLYEGDYADILQELERQDNPFYVRHKIRIPEAALRVVEQNLPAIAREMASKKTPIYPNFRWEGCHDCDVRDLCKAIQFGEDVDYLKGAMYYKSEGHETVRRQAGPVQKIRGIADLERAS